LGQIRDTLACLEKDYVKGRTRIVEEAVKKELGVDLSASYLGLRLRNPLVIAPGPLSQSLRQIERAARAGYGGMVLKSVIGEDKNGNASMRMLRTKPTFVRWVEDEEGNPVYHWNGGLDLRNLSDYLKFAEKAFRLGRDLRFPLVASFLCHLPKERDEEWKVDEWEFTVRKLCEAASVMYEDEPIVMEIDFCPFLKREKLAVDEETVLRWYREAPELVKEAASIARVVPKVLNLDFGLDFQVEIVKAAERCGVDGVVIANRFFTRYSDPRTEEEYFTAHGGKELRLVNQRQISEVKKTLDISVSATGGTYTGRHVHEYLQLGAENVQALTYIMRKGFEASFRDLMFNRENGLIVSVI